VFDLFKRKKEAATEIMVRSDSQKEDSSVQTAVGVVATESAKYP